MHPRTTPQEFDIRSRKTMLEILHVTISRR